VVGGGTGSRLVSGIGWEDCCGKELDHVLSAAVLGLAAEKAMLRFRKSR